MSQIASSRIIAVALMAVATLIVATLIIVTGWDGLLSLFGRGKSGITAPRVVRAGQDRGDLRHFMGRGSIGLDAKVSTSDLQGELFLWEISVSGPTGPGRHVHYDQDEWFYVLEGEFVAEVGDERFFLHPGDSILLPRGVPHTYAQLSDGTGKMLGAVLPAGSFEQFLEDTRLAGSTLTPEKTRELFEKHGLKEVGPPLDVRSIERDAMRRQNEALPPNDKGALND